MECRYPPEGAFPALLRNAVQKLGGELLQAYHVSLEHHLVERRNLLQEVAQLRAAARVGDGLAGPAVVAAAEPSPAVAGGEEPEPGPGVAQPPPAARVAPLLARREPPPPAVAALESSGHRARALCFDLTPAQALEAESPTPSLWPDSRWPPAGAQPRHPADDLSTTCLRIDPRWAEINARPSSPRSLSSPWSQTPALADAGPAGDVIAPKDVEGNPDEVVVQTSPRSRRRSSIGSLGSEFGQMCANLFGSQDGPVVSREAGDTRARGFGGEAAVPASRTTLTSTVLGVISARSTQVLYHRLHARLGHLRAKGFVKGKELYETLSALGLEKYSVKEMNGLVHRLGVVTNLKLQRALPGQYLRANSKGSVSAPTYTAPSDMNLNETEGDEIQVWAEWRWPESAEVERIASSRPSLLRGLSAMSVARKVEGEDHSDKVIPWKALMELFSKDEVFLEKLLGPTLTDQVFAMREVLLAGEANRLISELTYVKIDDLATRRRRKDTILLMDLLVSTMIVLNGVGLGLQIDRRFRHWQGWPWVQVSFSTVFVSEVIARQFMEGWRTYFFGPERMWNLFDLAVVGGSVADSVCLVLGMHTGPPPVLLRFIRVIRLSRLVRVFRLSFMRDLRLMVKGILGGLRTIFWAFVLLVFVLYALGVVTATLFGDSSDPTVQELFVNVPAAMFTTFQCVTGSCFTKNGSLLSWMLFSQFGIPFAVCFVAAYMLISLGLFNVILAIYVDITMVAAKQTEDANKGRHERECIRVAQITKRLLKIFCAAYRFYSNVASWEKQEVDLYEVLASAKTEDAEIDDDISISKELYLMVIQHPEVQQLMDDLDIPPDRANLFDNIDADGSGKLQASEMVRGFLKVRGEIKTDQIASILVLRSIQATLKQMGETMDEHRRMLMDSMRESKGTW